MSDDYKKVSDRSLADLYGAAKAQAKAEEKRLKALTSELVRRGKQLYKGLSYTVMKTEKNQDRFDVASVKIEMGEAWYDARKKATPIVQWEVSQKPFDEAAAALDVPPKPLAPNAAATVLETA